MNRQVLGRVAKVLLPKDYLRLWLTGEHVGRDVGCRGHQLAGHRRARLVG
jgi:sugar (pentulose or hexulose) kinase